MEALAHIFPKNDCTLLAFIVLLPLIGAFVNGVFGKRLGRDGVTLAGLSTVFVSFLMSVAAFMMLSAEQGGKEAAHLSWRGWQWMTVSLPGGDTAPISVGLSLDALNATMALVVTGVGFLIHLYSSKYMEKDPGYYRFFAYLNLFIFSMLVLILGSSLPVLFVGWEGVGLCSYLLIGFWFSDEANAAAGKKAFITNRIGDFGLLCAMGLLLYYCNALDWDGIAAHTRGLTQTVEIWPPRILQIIHGTALGSHLPAFLLQTHSMSVATLVCLALFLGAAGKSAQIPLYVWLPDAMAGPTPVSALIHAATMVTAGIYLLCRLSFVLVLSPAAMLIVASIGVLTAVFAATIAFAQTDIKKVLAYSTVSQLGYMFLGVGVGAFTAGFFHVVTHAFFKACLFLGAGSVIHAMHARIHDGEASQDMRNMGGLRKYMPYTFWTFTASWAAIIGIPFITSGFFSKDEILLRAFQSSIKAPMLAGSERAFEWPNGAGTVLYALGLAGAVMTAFYMTRLYVGIFFGNFKGWKIVKGWKEPAHGHDDHHHPAPGEKLEGPKPHESPWEMTLPLVLLGGLALVAGYWNAPLFHMTAFEHWLEPVFETASGAVKAAEVNPLTFVAFAIAATAVGAGGAFWVYWVQKGEPAAAFTEKVPGFYALIRDKWRIDEFYEASVIGAVETLAELCVWVDKWVVDGIVAGLTGFAVAAAGTVLRLFQTGRVQAYAAVMVVGLGGVGWFFLFPQAKWQILADQGTGAYSVTATPGLGYSYRWDKEGDGSPDSEAFGAQRELKFNLKPAQTRTVRLEVMNAFGRISEITDTFSRPRPDRSGAGPSIQQIDVEQDEQGNVKGIPRAPDGRPLKRPVPKQEQP